ncbi:hypothetical protein PRVXT_001010 [Proteinivorax tanatarense]|uniref:Uncharacterized protein n=1 Tax=Proteinivorax tanatarense TaxID=1260629 RepID=A0AAU7VP56_9FIRM
MTQRHWIGLLIILLVFATVFAFYQGRDLSYERKLQKLVNGKEVQKITIADSGGAEIAVIDDLEEIENFVQPYEEMNLIKHEGTYVPRDDYTLTFHTEKEKYPIIVGELTFSRLPGAPTYLVNNDNIIYEEIQTIINDIQ